jgi:simple sugar transport system ATP-binding protein
VAWGVTSEKPSRWQDLGESLRRFMLRPEATSVAAVLILFIVFTALSPQLFPPDRGELRFKGEPVVFTNPAQARERGIATVFQDLAVCELLSVTRNIVLGREPQKGFGPFKLLDLKRADEMARSALHQLGVRWERGVSISGGERQSLAIARAMFFGSSLLVLDEPTSALAVRQAGRVLEHIVKARGQG